MHGLKLVTFKKDVWSSRLEYLLYVVSPLDTHIISIIIHKKQKDTSLKLLRCIVQYNAIYQGSNSMSLNIFITPCASFQSVSDTPEATIILTSSLIDSF